MNTHQGEFDFDPSTATGGYVHWVTSRRVAAVELARRLNLPIEHEVEVWLSGGVKLRGKLHLREEFLLIPEDQTRHLELMIGHATFSSRDVNSCMRLD